MGLFDDSLQKQSVAFPTSDDDVAKQAQIKMMLARAGIQPGGGQDSTSLGVPYSGLPFSGLPRMPKATMFSTEFPSVRPSMSAPDVPFMEPPRPTPMTPIKMGSSLGEGIFERGLDQPPNKKPDAKESNLDAIRDALAASQNALAAYFQNGDLTASRNLNGSDRVTQGEAPGSKFFAAAKPRKRQYFTPDQAPEGVIGGVEEAPDMAGVPVGYFSYLTGQESGGNDKAVNKLSGASGRFQFMPSTVADLVRRVPGLAEKIDSNWRTDPVQQDALLRAYTQISLDTLKPIVKDRMPTMGELYAMHFFGHGGGYRALTNADKKLGELFPDIVFEQNPTLDRNMTPAQFVAYINNAWK